MSFLHQQMRAGRWVPPWLRWQNEARYQWAAGFVPGKRVVEIGCGSGHGTRRFVEAGAAGIDAFDVDEEAIRVAQAESPGDHVTFRVAAATELPVADNRYDLAVMLETIEHVDDDAGLVREVARVLRPGGVLLCTTPNRAVTNPGITITGQPFNTHHVREYTSGELEARIRAAFSRVEMLGQALYTSRYVGNLARVARLSKRAAVRAHQLSKLLGIPFDSPARHVPRTTTDGYQPEVLVAVATK